MSTITHTFAEELRAQSELARDWVERGRAQHDPELERLGQARLAELEELAQRNDDALAAS